MASFEKIFEYQPSDPIEFLYRENFITLSSIGNIFVFALINIFKAEVFDKFMIYILPPESFDFMTITLPDIGTEILTSSGIDVEHVSHPNQVRIGIFIREAIIFIFMLLLLYLLAIFVRFPIEGGFNLNVPTQRNVNYAY